MRWWGITALLLALGTPASAQEMRCDIAAKYQCAAGGGCQPIPAKTWNVVDLARKIIGRCDSRGCDFYSAQFARSGAFLNIAVAERGLMAKLGDDGSFTEVATLMGAALVSFGSCRAP